MTPNDRKPKTGPFYLLGDPWVHRSERGCETSILFGDDDPHVAIPFADTSCSFDCGRCNDSLTTTANEFVGENVHHDDAEWMVRALNFAANHPDGPGHPPSTRKKVQRPAAGDEEE